MINGFRLLQQFRRVVFPILFVTPGTLPPSVSYKKAKICYGCPTHETKRGKRWSKPYGNLPTPPPFPPSEAFIADPSYNPEGSKLGGLGPAKVLVDDIWQQRYRQTYYQASPSLSTNYKPNDISQLQRTLNDLRKTPLTALYTANYFDCSEMSALLQRELTIRGFESWIVIGKYPNVSSGHAWVVVFLHSPTVQLVPVEATALNIPQPGSSYTFSNGVVQTYNDYSHDGWVLHGIYQAIAWRQSGEFDYWNRTDILQKLSLPTIVPANTGTPTPTPTPTLTFTPTPTSTPPPALVQHIETRMQSESVFGYSYMNYTKQCQAGEIISGTYSLAALSASRRHTRGGVTQTCASRAGVIQWIVSENAKEALHGC